MQNRALAGLSRAMKRKTAVPLLELVSHVP